MSSGDTMSRDEGFAVVPKWNEEASSVDSFEEKVCTIKRGSSISSS